MSENFKMALESIKSNKLRSFLTMLGIIIGVSSVIAIVSLGRGGKEIVTGQLEKIGSSTIQIKVDSSRASNRDYISLQDINIIKEKGNYIKAVTPMVMRTGVCNVNNKEKNIYINGVTPDYRYIENAEIINGRYFTEKESIEGKSVVVLDEFTAKGLFGHKEVQGESIFIGNPNNLKKVTIVGVTKAPGYMEAAPIEHIPAMAVVPKKTLDNLFGKSQIDSILVVAKSKEDIEEASNEAINIISARHNNREKELYIGEKMIKQVEEINKVIDIFGSFISAVAGISLVVGGIGVMNIMLVSVTERTREIGIRKAIGATTKSILLQFLTEAVIISLIGGIIGLIIGVSGSFTVGLIMGVKPKVTIIHICLVLIFSSAVGIFFGIYPAKKAAELNPIDALREE